MVDPENFIWPESPRCPRLRAPEEDAGLVELEQALAPIKPLLRGFLFERSAYLDVTRQGERRQATLFVGADATPVELAVWDDPDQTVVVTVPLGSTRQTQRGVAKLLTLNHSRVWRFRVDHVFPQNYAPEMVVVLEAWFFQTGLESLPNLVLQAVMQGNLHQVVLSELHQMGGN